jgi:polyferredoxin
MGKLGYPRGLIRYTTQNAIDGKPTRLLRPRIVVYGAILAALVLGWSWGVTHRSPLIAEVLRDRNALYRDAGQGRIQNGYALKLVNKTDAAQRYRLVLDAAPAGVALVGKVDDIAVAAGAVVSQPVVLEASDALRGRHAVRFRIQSRDGSQDATVDSSFFGPM